jgi:3-oxoacyl-[acyl-carrier protein] reductase
MMDELMAAGPAAVGEAFFARMKKIADGGATPHENGPALAVYMASAESDGVTGKKDSAVWDPWRDLAQHRADLAESDVYTLRRITPGDRGLTWGK